MYYAILRALVPIVLLLCSAARGEESKGSVDDAAARLARQLAEQVRADGQAKVAVRSFRSTTPGDAGGRAIASALVAALQKEGIQVGRGAPLAVQGSYGLSDDPDEEATVVIRCRLTDDAGEVRAEFRADVSHPAEMVGLLGSTVTLPVDDAQGRNDALLESVANPKLVVKGGQLSADEGSPYAIELLAEKDGKLRPLAPGMDAGEALVRLQPGQRYAIRVINNSENPAAVWLTIGGFNIFAFEEGAKVKHTHLIVPPRSSTIVQGWYRRWTGGKLEITNFKAGEDLSQSAAGVIDEGDAPQAITAAFAAAWDPEQGPPEDEPGEQDYSVGAGTDVESRPATKMHVGRPRAAISLRYLSQPGPSATNRVARIGARKLGTVTDRYYISYEPAAEKSGSARGSASQGGLREAAGTDDLGFEVLPFEEQREPEIEGGFYVDGAGEIVAAAVARELDALGYFVLFELPDALESIAKEFGEKTDEELSEFPSVASVSGKVCFSITQQGKEATASLEAAVAVAIRGKDGKPAGEPIYRHHFAKKQTAAAKSLSERGAAGKKAALTLVQAFVQELVADPKLELALTKAVAAAAASGSK